ncbi:MAG: hypothetical protein JWO30_600 [Fibrobacteres bacterium]|nr:hypothetical protein [Fibrobacterota bacterium]
MSLRTFTARVLPALSSSGLLSGVLKGKKNLGPTLRTKFAQSLQLKAREVQFFELLVQFNQATDMEEKNQFFLHLSRFRNSRAKLVAEGQYLFFSRWYYPVVWNYFGINQKQKNPMEIALSIYPPLSPAQVEEAIRLLLELGLIKKLANGYTVTDNHLTTEPEFRGLIATQYNQQFLQLAHESLHHVDPKHRLFNTRVFSAARTTIDVIKEKMTVFQQEIQEILDRDPNSECIYTLGVQLYPNTRSPGLDKGD